jgi:hypothetical protein
MQLLACAACLALHATPCVLPSLSGSLRRIPQVLEGAVDREQLLAVVRAPLLSGDGNGEAGCLVSCALRRGFSSLAAALIMASELRAGKNVCGGCNIGSGASWQAAMTPACAPPNAGELACAWDFVPVLDALSPSA